jgi:hypothetical protein
LIDDCVDDLNMNFKRKIRDFVKISENIESGIEEIFIIINNLD